MYSATASGPFCKVLPTNIMSTPGTPEFPTTKIEKQIAEVIEDLKDKMEKEMTRLLELCKKHGIDAQLNVTVGLPAEEILKTVTNKKINLIVMAKRRKLKGFKSLLTLGSVSRKIIENTSCPVLMIDIEKKIIVPS